METFMDPSSETLEAKKGEITDGDLEEANYFLPIAIIAVFFGGVILIAFIVNSGHNSSGTLASTQDNQIGLLGGINSNPQNVKGDSTGSAYGPPVPSSLPSPKLLSPTPFSTPLPSSTPSPTPSPEITPTPDLTPEPTVEPNVSSPEPSPEDTGVENNLSGSQE